VHVEIAPPRPLRANPRLSTLHEVEGIIRKAAEKEGVPLSLAEIARRMRAKRTRPQVVRAAVAELARHKLVAVGSKGAFWIAASREVWDRSTETLA